MAILIDGPKEDEALRLADLCRRSTVQFIAIHDVGPIWAVTHQRFREWRPPVFITSDPGYRDRFGSLDRVARRNGETHADEVLVFDRVYDRGGDQRVGEDDGDLHRRTGTRDRRPRRGQGGWDAGLDQDLD